MKYMGGWHRVSNKNQPHISSIKFLKSRGFFVSRTTSTSIESFVELSPSSTSLIERVSKKNSSCKTVSQGVLKFRRLVQTGMGLDRN